MSTNAIRQGQMSARTSDGGAYSARLEAFQENYERPEFTDSFKEFNDILNASQIKSEKFNEAVLGSKVAPSTAKMYESHFQLAKEKFDQLYSDETLEYFSKDDAGMRKWAGMVDKLNQEIATYEQIYEDSFGTASANGSGITWSDHMYRANNFAGGEEAYFASQGLSLLNAGSFDETMKRIDSRGHTNLTLDLESGTFSYDSTGDLPENWLEPTDPNTAARLFSYQTEQGQFLGSLDFADKVYPTYTNYGEERVKSDNFTVMRNDYQFRLAAVNSYKDSLPEGDPNKGKATGDYLNELEAANSLGSVLDQFQDKILADLKQRSIRDKRKQSSGSIGGAGKDTLPPIYNTEDLLSSGILDEDGEINSDTGLSGLTPENLVPVFLDESVFVTNTIGNTSEIIYDKVNKKFYAKGTNTGQQYVEIPSLREFENRLKGDKYKQAQSLSEYVSNLSGSTTAPSDDDLTPPTTTTFTEEDVTNAWNFLGDGRDENQGDIYDYSYAPGTEPEGYDPLDPRANKID